MNENSDQQRSWVDLLAVVIAFSGAIISIGGALFTYFYQAQMAITPLWTLPGLVLLDWVFLGTIGFLSAYFTIRKSSARWLRITWFNTGTFIPLIILGAFSIGSLVLIAFLLFVISTGIVAVRYDSKWLESFGLLLLGSFINLGILLLIITLANQGKT